MNTPSVGDTTVATWLIIVTFLVWLAVDIYLYVNRDKFSTISEVITTWSYYTPIVPLIAGFLLGHWFW